MAVTVNTLLSFRIQVLERRTPVTLALVVLVLGDLLPFALVVGHSTVTLPCSLVT